MGAIGSTRHSLMCGCALVAPCMSQMVHAQAPPPAQQSPGEVIVVTGSRIPRTNLTAVSPVAMVKSEEVKLQGVTLTEELLNQLPMVTPDQGAFTSNGASGTATVDLRGLGASRTLVLINGRRAMPGDPSFPAPDINAIPSVLIKRVEVLTGGASSVYGSDAVAGVVNFILDTRLKGLKVDGQASFFQHDNDIGEPYASVFKAGRVRAPRGNIVDGGRRDINAAFGSSFLHDRGHVTVYAGYRELSAVTQNDRDYSICTLSAPQRNRSLLQCGGSSASFPGNFFTNFDTFQIGSSRSFESGFVPFNFAPWNYFQRPDQRYIGGGFADVEISPALKPYLEVMYMHDKSTAQVAPSALFPGGTESINCDSPLLSPQQVANICFTGNFVGENPLFDRQGNLVRVDGSPTQFVDPVTGATYFRGTLLIGRRNVEGGPRRDALTHSNLRIVGGVKGELRPGLTYEVSYNSGRVRFDADFTNELSTSHLQRSLDVVRDSSGQPVCRSRLTGEDPDCVPWDIFAPGGVTTAATDYLALEASRTGIVKEKVATAFVTAQLGEMGLRSPWATEGPSLNAGAEYRKDSIDFRPSAAYLSNDLAGSDPLVPYSGSLQVKELFAEARLPIIEHHWIERFAIEGGYRQSWYSNPDNAFKTNAYKLAFDLIPVRGLRFRGSHQRAVRAPNIVELFGPIFPDGFSLDPCAGFAPDATAEQCLRSGVTASQYGRIIAIPNTQAFLYRARAGGNPLLEPETATTRAIGVVLEPGFLPGFNATVDLFDISLKGAVAQIGAQRILDTCLETGDPLFCDRVHRDSSGSLWLTNGYVDNTFANIGAVKVRGVDIGANYTRSLGKLGRATFDFLGTKLLKHGIDNGGLSTPVECAGRYGTPCGLVLPAWKHTARLTWEARNGLSLSLHWRRLGRTKLASPKYAPNFPYNPRNLYLPAYNYFDLTALFKAGPRYALRFGVSNIFDKRPPLVAGNTTACDARGCNGNTFPQIYDPLGRFAFAGFTAAF